MSVIFKGLKMPTKCTDCIAHIDTSRGDIICGVNRGLVTYETISVMGRPVWCHAKELKSHGDLIDKDKIINDMNSLLLEGEDFTPAVKYVRLIAEHQPVVIESDKERLK